MTDPTTTAITGVHTIAVPVTDPDRAIDFYVGVLGFDKRRDQTYGGGQRWVEVAPPGAPTTVALAVPLNGKTGVDTGIRFKTADADADHASLLARGVDVDPEIMRWEGVPPMFTLRDPDGNTLVIVQIG